MAVWDFQTPQQTEHFPVFWICVVYLSGYRYHKKPFGEERPCIKDVGRRVDKSLCSPVQSRPIRFLLLPAEPVSSSSGLLIGAWGDTRCPSPPLLRGTVQHCACLTKLLPKPVGSKVKTAAACSFLNFKFLLKAHSCFFFLCLPVVLKAAWPNSREADLFLIIRTGAFQVGWTIFNLLNWWHCHVRKFYNPIFNFQTSIIICTFTKT